MDRIKECIFCKIVAGKAPADIIYRDGLSTVILDQDWAVLGHALVIWNEHHRNASDLTEEEYTQFSRVYHRAETALLEMTKSEKAVTLKSGGLVEHFHYHIYPVNTDTTWQQVQDIFNKKVKVQISNEDRSSFVANLTSKLTLS